MDGERLRGHERTHRVVGEVGGERGGDHNRGYLDFEFSKARIVCAYQFRFFSPERKRGDDSIKPRSIFQAFTQLTLYIVPNINDLI